MMRANPGFSKNAQSQPGGQRLAQFFAALEIGGRDLLGASMASGVWAWVQMMSGSATAFRRQPVAIRSICLAAL